MIKRIGFCCKWIDTPEQVNGIKPKDAAKKYNTGSTTVAWLDRQARDVAEDKLWELTKQNIESTRLLVEKVGTLDEHLRMVRISSDILPVYTHPSWSYFYQLPDVRNYVEQAFARVGEHARLQDVRLSFHPGQFCVLASDNPDIVRRSIEEFEYHVDMARYMGYGSTWHDHGFKINVHLSGRGGRDVFFDTLNKLTPEARNLITIENDEVKNGVDVVLSVADRVPIVLDIHHHWVHSGEYIDPADPRVHRIVESWRGVRPTLHYSVSREDLLVGYDAGSRHDLGVLVESGYPKSKLRAHSDFYWNLAVNQWAGSFIDQFDIQCESKAKNLASFEFARFLQESKLL
jgi:UV DNA damage repair endonuclease